MIDFELIMQSVPALAKGTLVTLELSIIGCFIGIVGGTLLGLLLVSNNTLLRSATSLYTSIIRGTPMLVQIFLIYYALPQLGIRLSAFWSSIIAIGMNSSAYVAHIVRSGIRSVPAGQVEAAQTLGFTSVQTMWYIILPQAFATVLPVLGNELITLVKDSSLASAIGVTELTKEANHIRSVTYDAITPLVTITIIYFIITSTLSLLISYFEKPGHVRS